MKLENVALTVGVCTLLAGIILPGGDDFAASVNTSAYSPYTGPAVLPLSPMEREFLQAADRAIIIAFRSDCPWSHASVEAWNAIADSLSAYIPGGRAAAVSREPRNVALRYLQERRLRFDLLNSDSEDLFKDWSIDRVPLTLLVDSSGQVLGAWVGAVDMLRAREIFAAIAQTMDGTMLDV